MKTIQIKSIVWIIGLLLSVSDISGQRIITNHPAANGYPVVDLTELSPLGCVLTSAEAAARRAQINAQVPSNDDFLDVGSGVSGSTGTWNAKMSSQYQMMGADVRGNWAEVFNACKQYSGEGGAAGQWRLPTQREMMMIWALYTQLPGNNRPASFGSSTHWVLTETGRFAFHIHMLTGKYEYTAKTSGQYARCVRDL